MARYTKEEEERDISLYLQGESLSSIAKDKRTWQAVAYMLQRNGIPRRRRGATARTLPPEQQRELIQKYKDGGITQPSLAKEFGVSTVSVTRYLREAGVKKIEGGFIPSHYKGGRTTTDQGYIGIYTRKDSPWAPMRNSLGYIPEHRLVMAKHLDRLLESSETVHHKNGNRADNRLENLELRSGKHGKGQRIKCRDCGSVNIEYY